MRYLFSLLFATAALMLTAFVSTAHALPLNPIPSPIAAGWLQEGSEPFTVGNPLTVSDSDAVPNSAAPQPFCNFFVNADADFANEIKLSPSFTIDNGYVPDIDGNTGIHTTINDGLREIRASIVLGANGLKVAIGTGLGFSQGLDLGSQAIAYTLRRKTDGSAVLEAGGRVETTWWICRPRSARA